MKKVNPPRHFRSKGPARVMLRNFRSRLHTSKGTSKGANYLRSLSVPMVLVLLYYICTTTMVRKKHGKRQGMRIVYFRFRSGPLPVTLVWGHFRSWHFRSKGPTRAEIAQLAVAHAQNILPDRGLKHHQTNKQTNKQTFGNMQSN